MTIYTTQDLIEILKKDRETTIEPAKQFIEELHPDKERIIFHDLPESDSDYLMSTIDAHLDIERQIREYQKEHNISGLIEEVLDIGGVPFKQLAIHNSLLALDTDFPILKQHKRSITNHWLNVVDLNTLQIFCPIEDDYKPVTLSKLNLIVDSCNWVKIVGRDEESILKDVVLMAGKGQLALMQDGNPEKPNYVTFFSANPLS